MYLVITSQLSWFVSLAGGGGELGHVSGSPVHARMSTAQLVQVVGQHLCSLTHASGGSPHAYVYTAQLAQVGGYQACSSVCMSSRPVCAQYSLTCVSWAACGCARTQAHWLHKLSWMHTGPPARCLQSPLQNRPEPEPNSGPWTLDLGHIVCLGVFVCVCLYLWNEGYWLY